MEVEKMRIFIKIGSFLKKTKKKTELIKGKSHLRNSEREREAGI